MGGGQYPDATPGGTDAPRRGAWIVAVVLAVVLSLVAGAWWLSVPRDTAAPLIIETVAPTSTLTPTPTPTPTPSPTPTPAEFGANTAAYDTAALAHVDVFAIHPGLPVDADPLGPLTEWRARSVADRAPVFADPMGQPVAALPREYVYGGTTVPVIERQTHWVKVLLVGRQAVPSNGDPAQLVGWLRLQDVELTTGDVVVHVGLSARTIDIVRAGAPERIASDFGWGTDSTPTPIGRSFVMTTRVEPTFGYTRGNPIVYLSVQSPTLDGFGGQPAAITAFHYHDVRTGPVSNGCLRVAAEVTHALAALPEGTPVIIWP